MWLFIGITVALFLGLVFLSAIMRREEIMANWSKYRSDPFFMFAAPLFKPDNDPRSRLKFATDNFNDNILNMLNQVFAVLLQPVFQVFKLFTDTILQTSEGLFNVKALFGNMFKKWNQMTDVFQRRFNDVFHRFRVTFTKIFHSMQKSYGVALSSLFAGISTIHTMTSFIDLVMKICIAILVILVVMVILLFFVLMPFIPMILTVIGIIAGTAFGGAVGGMAGAFCFTPTTLVHTDKGNFEIQHLRLGQYLDSTNRVLGILEFEESNYELYELDGIHVAGSHITYFMGEPILVRDHPSAIPSTFKTTKLYCLITTQHTIPIVGDTGIITFADWEEIDEEADLQEWNRLIFKILNGTETNQSISTRNEAGLWKNTQIQTPKGPVAIESLRPGDIVYSAEQDKITKVQGLVRLHPQLITHSDRIGNTCLSTGCWIKSDIWNHPIESLPVPGIQEWYHLFTEDGTFRLVTTIGEISIRDFSDIGCSNIEDTYEYVLKKLHQ